MKKTLISKGWYLHAYEGRAVAIVRANQPGNVKVLVLSDGLASASATVTAQ